jgi:hypothetical protein
MLASSLLKPMSVPSWSRLVLTPTYASTYA